MERSFAPKLQTPIEGPFKPPVPERRPPPHIASINAAIDYFKEKYPKKSSSEHMSALCKDALTCQSWAVEPELMQDLIEARLTDDATLEEGEPTGTDQIQRIRKALRAVSWQEHLQTPTEQLLKTIHHIKEGFAHEAHMARHIQAGEAAGWEEQIKRTDSIIDALRSGARGKDVAPATDAVEDLLWSSYREYQNVLRQLTELLAQGLEPADPSIQRRKGLRAMLVDRILGLRVVRDQLYFQAMYDGWYISQPNQKAV